MTHKLSVQVNLEELKNLATQRLVQETNISYDNIELNLINPPSATTSQYSQDISPKNKIKLIKFARHLAYDVLNNQIEVEHTDGVPSYIRLATAKAYIEKYFNWE